MAILVGPGTKVVVQGITGRAGTYYSERAMEYGTRIVAGVRPGGGGSVHLGVPVFGSVAQAMAKTGAEASLCLVPAASAADALIEAVEAELPLVVCITERVPVLDMVRVRQALEGSRTRLVGPNSQGVLAPGACMIGVMATTSVCAGGIGIASRSASLTSEIVAQTTAAGLGQSTTVGIGGDPVHGMGFVDCLELFVADPETKGIILVGEIGGTEEEEAARFLGDRKPDKPVVAFVAGRHAPPKRRMGHAGTLTVFGTGDAESKIEALRAAGAIIAPNAQSVGETMRQALLH